MKKFAKIVVMVIMVISLTACAYGSNGRDGFGNGGSGILPSILEELAAEDGDISDGDVLLGDGFVDGEIGDIMHTHQFDFAVNTVSAYGEEYANYTTDLGYRLLVVNTTIINTFSEPISLFDSDFLLAWDDGNNYDYAYPVDATGTLGKDFFPSQFSLDYGDEITGDLLFEVPAELSDLSLSYMEYDDEADEYNTFTVYFQVDAYADGDGYTDEDTYSDGNVSSSGGSAYGQPGDTMSTDLFNFQVKSATLYSEDEDGIPFDGYRYLVLEMALENKYQQEVIIYDSDFIVQWDDPDSYEYPQSMSVNGKELTDGSYELPLSGSTNVTMLYEVPEGVDKFMVYFEEYLEGADESAVYVVNFVPGQG